MGRTRIEPGSVAAAIASVLGGDAWMIGLAWGGDDGASMVGLGAALLFVGVLTLAATWSPRARPSRPPRAAASTSGAAPRSAVLSRG